MLSHLGIKNWSFSRVHDELGNWRNVCFSLLPFLFFLFEMMSLALTGLSVMPLSVYPEY